MQLINEEQYPAFGFLYLLKHGLEPLLEFAAVLSAGDKGTHVEAENSLIFKSLGHIATDDSLRETLRDCGFADAGLTDKHGVVLGLSRKNTYNVSYFGITTDNGVKLVFTGALDKVGAVFR